MTNANQVLLYSGLLLLLLLITGCAPAGETEVVVDGPVTTVELAPVGGEKGIEGEETTETEVGEGMSGEADDMPAETDTAAEGAADVQDAAEEDASASVQPSVSFTQPEDGAEVPTTFTVIMGHEGVTVEPSGEVSEGAGHMHILIDTDFVPAGEIIPADDSHLHFGDGSTETELTLPPGEHTLRLQFADGLHTALEGDSYRDEIVVTVVEPSE